MYKYLPVTSFCAPFCPAPGGGRPPLAAPSLRHWVCSITHRHHITLFTVIIACKRLVHLLVIGGNVEIN